MLIAKEKCKCGHEHRTNDIVMTGISHCVAILNLSDVYKTIITTAQKYFAMRQTSVLLISAKWDRDRNGVHSRPICFACKTISNIVS